ncbi:MAG: hypothetical protein IPK32_04210 [Verrucomicrobiaceae bacterium]|nr:hypothetical protein [Verrucomicrobiaceae bacterium]
MPDLSQMPWMLAVWSVAYFAIVAVHECGHYLAGLAVGVPRRNMRIRLLTFPQHVALRDGDEWGSPADTDRYIRPAEPLMPTAATAFIFVAGGFILETATLLLLAAYRLPFFRVACTLAFWMTVIYFAFDVFVYLRTRKAGMDFSAMCSISPVFGCLIVTAVLGIQFCIATQL